MLQKTKRMRATVLDLSEDGRLSQSERSLLKRPSMNLDNEKDYDSTLISIAQHCKRQNQVQGELSKTGLGK